MSKAKSYPSRELRRLRLRWLARNKRPLLVAAGFFVVAAGGATWCGYVLSSAGSWYVIGLIHASMTAAFLRLTNSAILAHEPRAVFQMRGAWGEDNTRSELKSATKRGLAWGWVDSIELQAGDLDHVVVTRSGGVIVLDSKFRTEVTAAGVADMAASAKRARLRTEALAQTLLRPDRSGRHRARTQSVQVTTCIVLWGPVRRDVPGGHVIDGVHFVDGRKLQPWLAQFTSSPVSEDAANELLDHLRKFRASAASGRR